MKSSFGLRQLSLGLGPLSLGLGLGLGPLSLGLGLALVFHKVLVLVLEV